MLLRPTPRNTLALLMIALSATAYAGEAPLTLNAALRRAQQNAPQLDAARHAMRANQAMAVAARELPDPQLTLGVDNVPVDGPDQGSLTRDFMTMRRIGVMQRYVSQDKRALKADTFLADAQRDAATREIALAALQRETAGAWLDLAIARRARHDMTAALAESARQVSVLEHTVASGKTTAADAIGARLVYAQMQDRATDIERDIARAKAVLARYVGDAAQRPSGDLPDLRSLPPLASHIGMIVEQHPDVVALQSEIDAATAQVRLADLATRPDWSAEVYYAQRGPAYSNMAGIQFSFDLPLFPKNRQYQERTAKQSRLDELAAQREAMIRAHQAEITGWFADWSAAREKATRIEKTIVPLATQRAALAAIEYSAGRASLETVLDNRKALLDSVLAQRDAERELARTWAQLKFVIPQEIAP